MSFEMERRAADGHVYLFRTDDEVEFVRELIAQRLDNYKLTGRVRFTVTPEGEEWMRFAFEFPHDFKERDWDGFPSDIEQAMHESYEVREDGGSQFGRWFVARHTSGPYV
jgi:hypothetical protein